VHLGKGGENMTKKTLNIKFWVKLGKNASDTCAMLSKSYGGEAMKKLSVSE
jgi:hypothetical protein